MAYTIGFILEQALGHVTHARNLMHHVAGDASIQPRWILPAFETTGLAARLPLYRSNWTLRAGFRSRRMLAEMQKQTRLDALFFHTQVTATLAQDWLRRYPSVVSLDATPRQYDALGAAYAHRAGPVWLEDWKWRLNRSCFRNARHIVTWSQWAKDGLTTDYEVPAEKVTVIPPGVTLSEWTPPTVRLPHPGVQLLFVGGDLERKGGLLLLDAFRSLRAELASPIGMAPIDVTLHLVTRQPLLPEPGIVVYNQIQPNTPQLKQLYFESDIFCLPTRGDCLPIALAEAGAAGLPIVSTAVGAIPEMVLDGETGFLSPPGDLARLIAVLRILICSAELRCRLGEQAARLVRRDHDAAANTARLLDLLKQTADENRRR